MIELPPWPDIEKVMVALLDPIATTYSVLPDEITPPVIRAMRIGGQDDGITDFPRVEVGVFAASRAESWELAEQCRQVILASRATKVGGALIDNAKTETPAQQFSYDNQDLRRVVAIYRMALRRPRTITGG